MADKELSPERIEELLKLEQRANDIAAREKAIAEQEQAVAKQQREGRIKEIVLALEGLAEADGVKMPEGRRHAPAVVTAVERILKAVSMKAPALRLALDGKEQDVTVEAIVLAIVNSLPEASLMKLENQPTPPPADSGSREITEEEAKAALAQLGLG